MTMAGQAVYRWATTKLTRRPRGGDGEGRRRPSDIDVFAPHQANLRIVESMTKRLGFPETTVIARDIVQSGNTSAASIPLALTALMESGEAKSGDLALVLGYGAGPDLRRPGARPAVTVPAVVLRHPDPRDTVSRSTAGPPPCRVAPFEREDPA